LLAPHLFVLGDQYPELLCVATSKKLILAGIALGVAGKVHQPMLCAVSQRPHRRSTGAVPIPGLFAVGGLLAAVGSHPRVQVKVARYFADTLKHRFRVARGADRGEDSMDVYLFWDVGFMGMWRSAQSYSHKAGEWSEDRTKESACLWIRHEVEMSAGRLTVAETVELDSLEVHRNLSRVTTVSVEGTDGARHFCCCVASLRHDNVVPTWAAASQSGRLLPAHHGRR
jgi:hypothetical protein